MVFLHLSDLHIGKRVNEFSMLEDQQYILTKILNILDNNAIDAVIIAGDIYDKSVPSQEAVQLFDDFLYKLSKRNLKVFIISGNHDSMERLAFGGRLMRGSGTYISPVYDGTCIPVTLEDEFGKINIYMLPFIKPANVKQFYPDSNSDTYSDAVKTAISHMDINTDERNIIITHQFVTGAITCESEEISVGGVDNVDAEIFNQFDYVALGHIHRPQSIKRETIRYSGTPLKYSFSEKDHIKSVTIVNMGKKGEVEINAIPLEPKRDLRQIRGTYNDLTLKSNYEGTNTHDYMHIILTDEEDVPDAIGRLRTIYPNIMKLEYDNTRTRNSSHIKTLENIKYKTPIELFEEFYEKQNGLKINDDQKRFIIELDDKIRG